MAVYIVQSRLENLKSIREWLKANLSLLGIDEQFSYGIITAVNEIVTNVIIHTHHENPAFKVGVEVNLVEDSVEVRVMDFCPDCEIELVETQDTDLLSESGFGLKIVKSLVDSFNLQKGPKGNVFILRKHVSSRVNS